MFTCSVRFSNQYKLLHYINFFGVDKTSKNKVPKKLLTPLEIRF